jgi:hypothetical protein
VLSDILYAMTRTTDPYQLQALAQAVQTLGAKLPLEQARAAFGPIRDAIGQTTYLDYLLTLADAVETLGPMLHPDVAQVGVEGCEILLARADEPSLAAAFAGAVSVLLPREPRQVYIAAIVELLKWPTTAGPATDALLEVLHERVPGAPGREAGLDATIAWVAETYPDIDLDSPPTFPASGSTGGGW